MKKENVLIFICLIIVIILISYITFIVLDKKEILSSLENNIDLTQFELENRTRLFVNNELLIGENIKQLENGYYDFKISNNNNLIIIKLNKLWHESYGEDYIQDEYLAKICREIASCLKVNEDDEEIEYQLYKYVKDNYLMVKQGKDGTLLELEEVSIYSKSIAGECVVYLKVK